MLVFDSKGNYFQRRTQGERLFVSETKEIVLGPTLYV
jgi:hypothetical protein